MLMFWNNDYLLSCVMCMRVFMCVFVYFVFWLLILSFFIILISFHLTMGWYVAIIVCAVLLIFFGFKFRLRIQSI